MLAVIDYLHKLLSARFFMSFDMINDYNNITIMTNINVNIKN